jgi:multiple sugar transport system ATP-binding protein
MGALELKSVTKSFGATDVIKGVDLTVNDGEFCVFVGPSGCGKSTLLRIIAGLEDATAGDILLDGKRVNDVAPAKRELAMVFQSYALYPHLTVRDNMGLALKQAGQPKATIAAATDKAAAMLSLDPLMDRRPSELSGGQRQRVAIGRAIVRTPKLFLFDEPLSNLDAALRVATRIEIARLHRDLGATMIYVTHDQVEAMTLADRIVVLRAGRVEQVGAPMELYNDPANTFVAGFIGSPQMNFLKSGALGQRGERRGDHRRPSRTHRHRARHGPDRRSRQPCRETGRRNAGLCPHRGAWAADGAAVRRARLRGGRNRASDARRPAQLSLRRRRIAASVT